MLSTSTTDFCLFLFLKLCVTALLFPVSARSWWKFARNLKSRQESMVNVSQNFSFILPFLPVKPTQIQSLDVHQMKASAFNGRELNWAVWRQILRYVFWICLAKNNILKFKGLCKCSNFTVMCSQNMHRINVVLKGGLQVFERVSTKSESWNSA